MKPYPSQKSYTVKEATLKLLQFCAYRDRSHKEVEEKLKELRMIPLACEQIITKLMREGFLNEERFARSFVSGKFRIKKWGRKKIERELKIREISAPIIKLAFTEIDEEIYLSSLKELAEKKLNLINEGNPIMRRKKLISYLLQKGYEPQLVYDLSNDLIV